MKHVTTLSLALGIAVAFAGSAAAQIKMGVAGPITGANAPFGAQLKNGTDMAVADINAAGGILGQKIALSYGDDVADPKQGVSVANKFAADGVKFVVGHFNSGVTMPSSEVYQENGILEVTPSATNPQITERNMWNIFRTCGRDDQQGAVAAAYILQHFKGKKVAIVHDKTTYGQGLANEAKKAMNAKGMKEVLYEGINIGDKDFSALVSKIKASGADLVYALQLRGSTDHEGSRRAREVSRSQEGRRGDAFRDEIQDRDRRHFLQQEGRYHPPRLRRLYLEEGRQRQDHLCRVEELSGQLHP